MTRAQMIGSLCGLLTAVALAYFAVLFTQPQPIARILMSRGYADRGWTQERLAGRIRALAAVGALIAATGIVLSVKLFLR